MAFIKRSTVTPVDAKIGKCMSKCASCGMPFVSKISTNLCNNCTSKTVSDEENLKTDLDQE